MSLKTKKYIISYVRVFVASGLASVALTLNSGVVLDKAGLTALITAALSTAIKATIEKYLGN